MEGIKKGIRKAKQLASNRIDSRKLKPGDHIYVYRGATSYSHHGIYIGGDNTKYVIHYTQSGRQNIRPSQSQPCSECGCWSGMEGGVIKSCLDCFVLEDKVLGGRSVYLYEYGVSDGHRLFKRSGTCTNYPATKTTEEVLQQAEALHKVNGFGDYDLTKNNCEHFATFCKTGERISEQANGVKIFSFSSSSSS